MFVCLIAKHYAEISQDSKLGYTSQYLFFIYNNDTGILFQTVCLGSTDEFDPSCLDQVDQETLQKLSRLQETISKLVEYHNMPGAKWKKEFL